MDLLRIGDSVLSMRPDATPFLDEIYMFGHKDSPNAKADFVRLQTISGVSLRLTHDHHVRIERDAKIIKPSAVVLGDVVYMISDTDLAPCSGIGPSVSIAQVGGLYNHYTLGGTIVVDGVIASVHSSSALDWVPKAVGVSNPTGYQALFAPIRAVYRLIGREQMASFELIIDMVADVMNASREGNLNLMENRCFDQMHYLAFLSFFPSLSCHYNELSGLGAQDVRLMNGSAFLKLVVLLHLILPLLAFCQKF